MLANGAVDFTHGQLACVAGEERLGVGPPDLGPASCVRMRADVDLLAKDDAGVKIVENDGGPGVSLDRRFLDGGELFAPAGVVLDLSDQASNALRAAMRRSSPLVLSSLVRTERCGRRARTGLNLTTSGITNPFRKRKQVAGLVSGRPAPGLALSGPFPRAYVPEFFSGHIACKTGLSRA